MWRYIRAFSNKGLRKPNQTHVSEDSFIEAFNKLAPLIPQQQLSDRNREELEGIPFDRVNFASDFLLKPFADTEYNESVSFLKIKSAPGSDLISNQIIKKLPQELHIIILKIFNIMFNKGIYPKQWSNYFTVFIPKLGKKEPLRPFHWPTTFKKFSRNFS